MKTFDKRTRAYRLAKDDALYALKCFCETFRAIHGVHSPRDRYAPEALDVAAFFARESAENAERAWAFFAEIAE
jgi:hypothetical protein